jgi:electron transfer flavoprotein alpha subunit
MQIGARYLSDVELRHGEDDFQLSGTTFRRRFQTTESLRGAGAPLVVTLLTGNAPRVLGDDEAEVIVLQSATSEPSWPRVEGRRSVPTPGDPASARLVIAGGAGLGSEADLVQLERLATALGAPAVLSPTAHAKHPAGPMLPLSGCAGAEVYVAFGISGSERHLASVPASTRIIAVNTDPDAPIMQVADQALIADAHQTINEMLAELEPEKE